jgi:hypothetical protein
MPSLAFLRKTIAGEAKVPKAGERYFLTPIMPNDRGVSLPLRNSASTSNLQKANYDSFKGRSLSKPEIFLFMSWGNEGEPRSQLV